MRSVSDIRIIAGTRMEKLFALTVWLGVMLYATIGLVGIVAFHQGAPDFQALSGGYGVAFSTLASSESVR
ncbi:MAG: hypothetical protein KGI48_09125 [Hyphomicrobiales bacterium]|nr:hypothetical protein [Hyphomicrobiales bacterium]